MREAHIYRHYLRSESVEEDCRPRHYLDTRTFKIFASMPEEVSSHGPYSFRWTRSKKQTNRWKSRYWVDITTYISTGDNQWLPFSCGRLPRVRQALGNTNNRISDLDVKNLESPRVILDELTKIRADFKKRRTSRLARERRARIKAKQAECNMSEKEAIASIAEEKFNERNSRATKADVQRTKRIIAVAPLIRDLKTEVDAIMKQLESDPSCVKITYVKRASRDIASATNFLSAWNKGIRRQS